jgi:hypothetical protein
MPIFKNVAFPPLSKKTQKRFLNLSPAPLQPPSPSKKDKNSTTLEKITISPIISLGMTSFTKLKIPKPCKKSDFLLKVLKNNAENPKKIEKRPVQNTMIQIRRQKNIIFKDPKNFSFNQGSKSHLMNSFNELQPYSNLSNPDLFSTLDQDISLHNNSTSQVNKKIVIKPRFSRFLFEPS